jgi:Leucine Rich repeat
MDDIDGDPVAIAFSDMLRVNKSLTSLNLSSNWFTPIGIKAIALALLVNYTLVSIDIGDNKISKHDYEIESDDKSEIDTNGATAIADIKKVNTILTRLSLRQAEIPSSDVECIFHAM